MHPYSISGSRTQIAAYLMFAAVGVSSVANYLINEFITQIPYSFEVGSVSALACYSILYLAFDRVLWKHWPFSNIAGVPHIGGNWVGPLESSHSNDQATGEQTATDSGTDSENDGSTLRPTFRIKQTWTEIEVVGQFNESWSESMTASFITNKGQPELVITYVNYPRGSQKDPPPQHTGTNKFRCVNIGEDESVLYGGYYTDEQRNNHGTMELTSE